MNKYCGQCGMRKQSGYCAKCNVTACNRFKKLYNKALGVYAPGYIEFVARLLKSSIMISRQFSTSPELTLNSVRVALEMSEFAYQPKTVTVRLPSTFGLRPYRNFFDYPNLVMPAYVYYYLWGVMPPVVSDNPMIPFMDLYYCTYLGCCTIYKTRATRDIHYWRDHYSTSKIENANVSCSTSSSSDQSGGEYNRYWSRREKDLLIRLVAKHGHKWRLISKEIRSKTKHQCKSHYQTLIHAPRIKWKPGKALMDPTSTMNILE
jgi:hypothetical protein